MARSMSTPSCSFLRLLLLLMGLSTAAAVTGYADHAFVSVTNPTASCLDEPPELQVPALDQDVDLQVERDLLLTGKRYNLPPLLPRQSSIPSNWIVSGHPSDDERQHSTFVKIQDCISNSELNDILSMKSFLKAEWIMNDRAEETEHYHVVHRVEPLLKEK